MSHLNCRFGVKIGSGANAVAPCLRRRWRRKALKMALLSALLPLALLCAPPAARAFAPMEPDTAYAATLQSEGLHYEALLRLRPEHRFILHERLTLPGGAVEEKSRTGLWRQVGGGALLQLASRDGPVLRLNVGGENTLYGEVQRLGIRPMTAAFHAVQDRDAPYDVTGWLFWEGKQAQLRDAGTGRLHALEADAELEALARQGASFLVEARVQEHREGGGLRLVRLDKASPREPGRPARQGEFFADMVEADRWRLSADGLPPLSVAFAPKDAAQGALEITGPGLRVPASYKTDGSGMAFAVREDRILPTPEARALLGLLREVRHWDAEGDVLVLSGDVKTLCILEKTGVPRVPASVSASAVAAPNPAKPESPLWNWSRP